ncbi:MAG TPA: hypothetical protein ACFE0H_11770 [Elainellaceae cyanobacterium]
MTIQTFPLEKIQKVRRFISNGLTVTASSGTWAGSGANDGDELPEPESIDELGNLFSVGSFSESDDDVRSAHLYGKWSISTVDLAGILIKLPGLTLKPGIRLVSYLYRIQDDGVGVVWALPEDYSHTAQLEDALIRAGDRHQYPKPTGVLDDVMDAIEGDRSHASFLIASILRRELQEFGAIGRSRHWEHHRLINTLPAQVSQQLGSEPRDFSPRVRLLPDERAAVEFFTCRITPPHQIFRHVDQYPPDRYTPDSLDRLIATAQH